MKYDYMFGDDLLIPDHDNIVLFGGGLSMDMFLNSEEGKVVNRDNTIIISCNGSISLMKPTFQICGDKHAIEYWSKHRNNDRSVQWIARENTIKEYADAGVTYIPALNLFDKRKYRGAGLEAFNVAYYIWYYRKQEGNPIKNIFYTGFDMVEVHLSGYNTNIKQTDTPLPSNVVKKRHEQLINDQKVVYSYKSEVMPYQEAVHAPYEWWKMKYKVVRTINPCYNAQLQILSSFNYDESFRNVLQCRSYCNIAYLNDRLHDTGFSQAVKQAFYK